MKKLTLLLLLLVASLGRGQNQNTPNIGLQLPPFGSNNWNVPLNYNFTQLDLMLSGNLTIPGLSVSGVASMPLLTTWRNSVTYSQNEVVAYQGVFYTSLTSGNLNNTPANGSFWSSSIAGGGSGAVASVFGRTGAVVAASGDYVVGQITGAAPLISPGFSGVPLAPTASTGTNNSQIATTQFVQTAVAAGGGLPSASGINQAPISTGAGTTYNAATVPVSFGTAQNQFIQQSVTNSNYTTLCVNSLNDELWVECFTGGPYTGVGQTEVAWTTATNYNLGQVVSFSGGHYVAITYPNASITPTSNVTVWWPKATGDATTQADMAFATAAGQAAAVNRQITLRAGSGNWNMTGWIEPGGLYSVNIIGCGIFCANWNFTGTSAVPMVLRNTGGGAFTFLQISDAYWQPNAIASSIFDLGSLNQGEFRNMQWSDPAPSGVGAGGNFFARFGESGGDAFQTYVKDVTFGTSTQKVNSLASVTANVVGGSITSYTVNSGSTFYPAADSQHVYEVLVKGYKGGTAIQPCTVMPVGQVVTVVSGAVTAVSEGTNGGGSGCSGTIDVSVYTFYPVQYGIYDNASDSTFDDIAMYSSSPSGAGIYDNGGDSNFNHMHPSFISNGIATICDGNVFNGTELDNVLNQGFQFIQAFANTGCSVSGTHAYGVTPGLTPYYFASTSTNATISASADLCANSGGCPTDWHEFVTQAGTIDVNSDYATKATAGLVVVGNDRASTQPATVGDWIPTLAVNSLTAASFNPTSVSSTNIIGVPLGTATSGANFGSSTTSGDQASIWNGTTHATITAVHELVPGTGTNPGLQEIFQFSSCPSNCLYQFNSPMTVASTLNVVHLQGIESPAPTIAAGSGAGTSPTVAVVSFSSDLSGYFTVTTGTSPVASSTVVTVTFGTTYAFPYGTCNSWPANPATQALVGAAQAQIFPANSTQTTFALTSGSTPLPASTPLEYGYRCTQ